jgi:hypothetical protein
MIEEANPMAGGWEVADVPSTLVQVLPYALGVMAGAAAYDGVKKVASWAERARRAGDEREPRR